MDGTVTVWVASEESVVTSYRETITGIQPDSSTCARTLRERLGPGVSLIGMPSLVGAVEHGRRNFPGTEGEGRGFSVTRVSS
jgi:hypothetical protein